MKKLMVLISMFFSVSVMAGGFTASAVPTGVDIVRNAGFMIYGDFGKIDGCTVTNQIFVKSTHPQYNQLYATALAAFMSGKKVLAYVHTCEPVGWYSVDTTTFPTLTPDGVLYIRN